MHEPSASPTIATTIRQSLTMRTNLSSDLHLSDTSPTVPYRPMPLTGRFWPLVERRLSSFNVHESRFVDQG
jgi:hypothetical protein